MKGNNDIANKVNSVSMPVSSSVLEGIRKKRTPLYVAKNHIALHKVRYGVISTLLVLLAISPFVLNTKEDVAGDAIATEQNNGALNGEFDSDESAVIALEESKSDLLKDLPSSADKGNVGLESQATYMDDLNQKKDAGSIKKNANKDPLELNLVASKEANETKVGAKDDKKNEGKEDKIDLPFSSDDLSELKMDKAQLSQIAKDKQVVEMNKLAAPEGLGGEMKRLGFTSIGVNAGVFADKMLIEGNENSEKLRNALSSKMTSSIGVELIMPLYKGWNLRTGVSYLSRTENFSYLNLSKNEVLKIDTVYGVIHIPGQPSKKVVRYDSSYVNDGKHVQMDKVNKVSYIELPISFSHTVWSNQKIAVSASFGMRFGLLQNVEGYSFNNSGEVLTLNKSNNVVYKKTLNTSAELSLDLDYKLSEKWNVFVQPTMRSGLGSLSTSNMGYDHNYTMYGLVTGLRMRL